MIDCKCDVPSNSANDLTNNQLSIQAIFDFFSLYEPLSLIPTKCSENTFMHRGVDIEHKINQLQYSVEQETKFRLEKSITEKIDCIEFNEYFDASGSSKELYVFWKKLNW